MKKIISPFAYLLPDQAKKVFEGQIFDVYQWPATLFDGTTVIFEMLKRADTMQVIAVRNGRLVLVLDEQPGRKPALSFPGGRAELSDGSWINSAKRELLEETGMTFANWKLLSVEQPAPKIEWFTPVYVATDFIEQVEQKLDSGEKIEIVELEYNEVASRVLSGKEPRLSYMLNVFSKYSTLEQLLSAPEFEGLEVDR